MGEEVRMYGFKRGEEENPAWPGLVDVFAFTLVFVLLLGIAHQPDEKIKELEEENNVLQLEIGRLKNNLVEINEMIKGRGLKELKELFEIAKKNFPDDYKLDINEDSIEISITTSPAIFFNTAEYKLHPSDHQRLGHLAPILLRLINEKPFYLLINGTADPRPLHQKIPPQNNIELSALRSATVADILEKAAPGLGSYLRVTGLGVRGEKAPPHVDTEEYYRQFRTVSLVIKVDTEKLRTQFLPSY
ncbi:MAG: hypothetical protein QW358_03850 [Candidatus Hadarchaeum sp.]